MTCCTGGDCCGPGSYCCANTGPHTHENDCSGCGGQYPKDRWPGDQYDGHWDTCPNRPCGWRLPDGCYCRAAREHVLPHSPHLCEHGTATGSESFRPHPSIEILMRGEEEEKNDLVRNAQNPEFDLAMWFTCVLLGHKWKWLVRLVWPPADDPHTYAIQPVAERCKRCGDNRGVNMFRWYDFVSRGKLSRDVSSL